MENREKLIKETIETIAAYLYEENWRYCEPPLGKEECELFLELLTRPMRYRNEVLKDFTDWFANQKRTGLDRRNGQLLVERNNMWNDALMIYMEEHNE